jgi:hypothetical protein
MKTLMINDTQKLKEIKDAFNANYPHLKIEFFSEEHKTGEASSRKAMYEDSLTLKEIRKNHTAGELSIDGHQKTSTFENNFHNHFGVTVQVFRRSGNLWLQTTTTDEWSLAHQEKTGQEFDN